MARRTKNILAGPKWSGVDSVMTIGAVGVLAFAGYFMLKSGKGVEEGLQTAGDWGKNLTDAINSTGSWIGGGSKWLQDRSYEVQKSFGESVVGGAGKGASDIGERLGNAGCWIQQALPFGIGGNVKCTDLNKKDIIIIKQILTASPKPVPKITNNVASAMQKMGIYPSQFTY